jgi:hypothetical protein
MNAKEINFEKLYDFVEDYILNGYSKDDGIYVDFFNLEREFEVEPLANLGFDLNDDGSLYRDENGRPVNTEQDPHIHLAEDITMIDKETGERVPNAAYISALIDKWL